MMDNVSIEFSHIGLCVSNLERSLRFYCDGLGFERGQSHTIGDEFAVLMDFESVALHSQFIHRDGVNIELLAYDHPAPIGEQSRRPLNQVGLTHLNLRVGDVAAAAAQIEAFGGAVHTETRTTFGDVMDFVYCTDPDGTRIELMRLPT
jgi:glyoxylase I family protein